MLVKVIDWAGRWRNRIRLRSYLRNGLKVGENVRFIGRPEIGGTPYLVEIRNDVTIADGVAFVTHDGATNLFRHLPEYKGRQKFGRIIIQDNCFVGMRSIILPNVSIGPNALVAAGSVVTRSVPPNSVVGGAPARYICSFDEYVRKAAAECGRYPPEVLADPRRLRDVLLSTLPVPQPWDGESASTGQGKIREVHRRA